MPHEPRDGSVREFAGHALLLLAGTLRQRTGRGGCPRPCTPLPYRRRPASRRCGSARWSCRSCASMLWRKCRQVNESRGVGGISKGLLAKNRVSDNVGGVKYFLSVLTPALVRARHFALAETVPFQPRLARNHFRSGTQSD